MLQLRFLFLLNLVFGTVGLSAESRFFPGTVLITGDSHINAFAGLNNVSEIIFFEAAHSLNPTMYKVGVDKERAQVFSHERLKGLKEGDAIIFSLGCLDANWLIWNQIHEKNRDLDEVVNSLVSNYIDAVFYAVPDHVIKIIYNVLPPSNNEYSPPYVGTIHERILYSRMLNTALAAECEKRNLPFLDVYNDYCDKDEILRVEISDGNHHINASHNQMLLEKLWQILDRYSN